MERMLGSTLKQAVNQDMAPTPSTATWRKSTLYPTLSLEFDSDAKDHPGTDGREANIDLMRPCQSKSDVIDCCRITLSHCADNGAEKPDSWVLERASKDEDVTIACGMEMRSSHSCTCDASLACGMR